MRREQEVYRSIYLSCKDGQRLLSTGILSEMLYKVLLKYNDCTCIGTPRWKANKNVPIVIFKSVENLTEHKV